MVKQLVRFYWSLAPYKIIWVKEQLLEIHATLSGLGPSRIAHKTQPQNEITAKICSYIASISLVLFIVSWMFAFSENLVNKGTDKTIIALHEDNKKIEEKVRKYID